MTHGEFDAVDRAAQAMHAQPSVEQTLSAILQAISEALPTFEHVGISLTRRGQPLETTAANSDLVEELDSLQYGLGEGPCVDTLHGFDLVAAPRIRHDQRWPQYVGPAVERGLRSQLAVRMYLDEKGTVGGLNLYSTGSDEVTDADMVLARLFATHAALALGKARAVDSLTEALLHRQTIGQAIGMLAQQHAMSVEAAQAYLWRISSHQNRKVRDLPAEIVRASDDRAQRSTHGSNRPS